MRDQTAALIRRYYEAFDAGDGEAMLALLDEGVVHDINQGGREVGRDAFRAFLAHMDGCYRERIRDLVVMVDETGSRAAAEFLVEGRYQATDGSFPAAAGQDYRLPAAGLFEVRDGRITRVSTYYNLQDWLRQVGGDGAG